MQQSILHDVTERPIVLVSQPSVILELGDTTFTRAENFIIFLSYLVCVLTFPIAILFCLKTANVFERFVVFRLGKIRGGDVLGPGLIFMLPCIDEYVKVDLRTRSFDVKPQEIITKDSVSIQVDAVVYYSVENALNCVIQIRNVRHATKLLAQATLRTVVGTKDMMQLLTAKQTLSNNIETTLGEATKIWGIRVERVEIKQIYLPENMQRAMAVEQEADRQAQAKIVAARGELDASSNLKAASDVMRSNPVALQLRYLQTLSSLSSENNHTVVFPLPLDVMRKTIMHFRKAIYGDQTTTRDNCSCETKHSLSSTKVNKKLQTSP